MREPTYHLDVSVHVQVLRGTRNASELGKRGIGSGSKLNTARSEFTYRFEPADVWGIR